ncbi:2'-5' RNA ligase family protein [Ferrovibrio sp.]|uniref:2'-5' RNA ligase family protein n=1 Tax=Ferrovibrio sp. TaxID=1917215 RepID=UPI0025B8AF24|nr:2'-5' RNA ligase family protein [Ferrovibrio sp.]MBX3453935.1 2'-5' RNA ligase family protein [Ferrovibrio sp.]
MQIAIILTFAWAENAASWLDAIRAQHDPQHKAVPPHVTLLFPTDAVTPQDAAARAERLSAMTPAFAAHFDRLEIFSVPGGGKYPHLVYLLPDAQTAAHCTALHDALPGPSAPDGDRAPFEPHVTIARFGAVFSAKALLRQHGRDVTPPLQARCDGLRLIHIEQGAIRLAAAYQLAPPDISDSQ